jgi:hypothetical protein
MPDVFKTPQVRHTLATMTNSPIDAARPASEELSRLSLTRSPDLQISESVRNARLSRDLVTMLTRPEFSFDLKKEIFCLIVNRYEISTPDIQNILNEALETAVVEKNAELVSEISSLSFRGVTPVTTFFPKPAQIGDGADSVVYSLSEHLIAKKFCLPTGRALSYSGAQRGDPYSDFRIQQQLFDAGVNVPRPLRSSAVAVTPEHFSRLDPRPPSLECLLEKGLVMERISGTSGSRWQSLDPWSYALYKLNTLKGLATGAEFPRIAEYLKAICAGLIPRDAHRGNVIFSERYKSTFLIDFSRWSWWRKPGSP